ncbi:hypothetical protein LY76DRAFT_591785 [Colletotrichum caudatum]|nr:hypothetical protein LY76DRAFT_591785 [Colletotrichum caudatum]
MPGGVATVGEEQAAAQRGPALARIHSECYTGKTAWKASALRSLEWTHAKDADWLARLQGGTKPPVAELLNRCHRSDG